MALKSSTLRLSNSTRMGKRPCNSGIRSLGLLRWKAPEAINRMWSVLIMPYLVCTVVPSTSGNKSRCTPWRETSPPWRLLSVAILSISSKNTMPCCSTAATACTRKSSSFTSLAASSSSSSFMASATFMRCDLVLPLPIPANMSCNWLVKSSIPGGPIIDMPAAGVAATSTSTSLLSSSPRRSIWRNFWRVLFSGAASAGSSAKPAWRGGGKRASRMRFSAASWARSRFLLMDCSRIFLSAISIRSRTMLSTSRPT